MIKISDAIKEIISENSFLEFGICNKLLNLTQLAKFIKPLLEVKTKKEIQTSAIVMNLSRLQKKYSEEINVDEDLFQIDNISVFSNLVTLTFTKTPETHKQINKAYEKIFSKGYCSFSESMGEITIIFEQNFYSKIISIISEKPKYENQNVSAIGVKFSEELFHNIGLLNILMQKLTLQGINLIEITSTFTEFIFYIEEKDLSKAFDTLHHCFMKKK